MVERLRRRPEQVVKPLLFILLALPFAALLAGAVQGTLGANPVERITHTTGEWALRLLIVTLMVTPARRLLGWTWLVRLRRMLGLYAFFYVSLHLLGYVWLDHFFDWPTIIEDIVERPYVTVGFAAFILLVPLAATSSDAMVHRLGGRRWRALHRLAYLATLLGCLHFLWLVKADQVEPLVYGGVTLALLAARLPWQRLRRRPAAPAGHGAGQPRTGAD